MACPGSVRRARQQSLRLILPTPNWDGFVDLAFSEIHLYGSSNFRVTRRLYTIIEDLMNVLPETRQDALQRQLKVLNDTLERQHLLPENPTLARIPTGRDSADAQRHMNCSSPVARTSEVTDYLVPTELTISSCPRGMRCIWTAAVSDIGNAGRIEGTVAALFQRDPIRNIGHRQDTVAVPP